jgi:hypothetical protein
MSEPDVSQISVLDPIDGGLITELNSVSGEFIAGQDNVVVEGLTYQLENKAIAQVEYRVNGDQWQHAAAQDGAFDSSEEAFQVTLGPLYAGTYLVEVRAGDAEGQIEVDFASQQFTVLQNTTQVEPLSYQLFLPVLIR